jgi:tetratricopeptide (TPR) repeat protein
MKKLLIVLIAAMPAVGFAQSGKVTTAWKNHQDYQKSKDPASLQKAKDAIDLATVHEETKVEPKTWKYRADIYLDLYELALRTATDNVKDVSDVNKKTMMGYQNAPSVDLDAAQEAYRKVLELDKKNVYTAASKNALGRIATHYQNRGIALYNVKSFAEAVPAFEKAYEVNGSLGVQDTNNLVNIAIAAEKGKVYDKAKMYYQKMIDTKQGGGSNYASLYNVHMAMGDTVGAMDIVKKGRTAYPDDVNLLITETNYFLKKDKKEDALNNLKLAIQKKPNDANLYLVLGNVYDNLANPKDAAGKELPKPANYEELLANAETNYKKAIELKADYFDALYNLGALYNNHGVVISKAADSIKDMAKYNAENKRATDEYNKALPYLEKAHTMNASDKPTMYALKQIYARLNMPDKVKEMNDKINAGKSKQ